MAGEVSTVSLAWAVFSVIGGSIIGAACSAIVSFVIQKRNLDSAKRQRDEDRLQVRKALGYSLLFKMIKLSSNLENLSAALKSCFANAEQQGFTGAPWQIVEPMVPATDTVHFSPEEMALILSLSDHLFNDMAAIDNLHNSTAALFNLYGLKREKVLDRFGATMSGSVGKTGLTQEQADWLAPRAVELNALIKIMSERADADGKKAWAALLKLRDLLEVKLEIRHRLERAPPVAGSSAG